MSPRAIPLGALDPLEPVEVRGTTEAAKHVTEFLEDALVIGETTGDVEVHLTQTSRGSGVAQAICTFSVRAGEDLQESARQIVDEAVRDAREGCLSGKIRYAVKVAGLRGRRTFVLNFASREVDVDDLDLPPIDRTAFARAMQRNEELHRSMITLVTETQRANERTIAELARTIDKLVDALARKRTEEG